jgi:hypothetical protein
MLCWQEYNKYYLLASFIIVLTSVIHLALDFTIVHSTSSTLTVTWIEILLIILRFKVLDFQISVLQ